MDAVNEFFSKVRAEGGMKNGFSYPRMTCADGFSMSVQGHEYAYCAPREHNAIQYHLVEVGFPSAREGALMQYAETPETPTETVYGYVPVEVVNRVIADHGGLAP